MNIITGHQPVYLPWLGLFHKISLADVFVFMDDVQYLSQDWNNRNRIKGPQGAFWLTVPVRLKHSSSLLLKDIRIHWEGCQTSKRHWQRQHWRSLQSCYGRARYWELYAPFFEELYTTHCWKWLSELNEYMLRYFLKILDLESVFIRASTFGFEGYKSDLILDHCQKLNADVCVLGMHGQDYLREEDFLARGIFLYYQRYEHPQYDQFFDEFISHLSIVDLLFHYGPQSRDILLSGNVTKATLGNTVQQYQNACVIHLNH